MDAIECDCCSIYGCRNKALPGKTVEVTINGLVQTLQVCDEHFAFFNATNPDRYMIGYTFNGEVEVRPVPNQPAPQSQRPE